MLPTASCGQLAKAYQKKDNEQKRCVKRESHWCGNKNGVPAVWTHPLGIRWLSVKDCSLALKEAAVTWRNQLSHKAGKKKGGVKDNICQSTKSSLLWNYWDLWTWFIYTTGEECLQQRLGLFLLDVAQTYSAKLRQPHKDYGVETEKPNLKNLCFMDEKLGKNGHT